MDKKIFLKIKVLVGKLNINFCLIFVSKQLAEIVSGITISSFSAIIPLDRNLAKTVGNYSPAVLWAFRPLKCFTEGDFGWQEKGFFL